MSTLVIRFSSLGDVVLAGAVTGALAPATFVTSPRWAEIAERLAGVERVLRWGEDRVSREYNRVVDLHASPRSRWLCLRLLRPARRAARHDLRRRLRVWTKQGAPPPRVIDRYAAAAGTRPAPPPWIDLGPGGDTLLLCPGAAHLTKRWPPSRWVELGRLWKGPVAVLGSAGEAPLVRSVADAIGTRAEAVAERGFARTFEALGRGRVAVAGDTGLLHLCAAAGLPVVGLFGPTTSLDGFWCHEGEALELELACRPCSRFGGETCPIGDHMCLDGLPVDRVWRAIGALS